MKKLFQMLIVFTLVTLAVPAFAQDTHNECSHSGGTIADLRQCVEHAVMMEHIDNSGVANSLFAKLDSAQAALDRGQVSVAVNTLNALAHAVEAQAGKHINEPHATHLLDHINRVIDTLSS